MDSLWCAWRARAIENMEEPMRRRAVRLFDEGKTPPQIASILDIPYADVHRFLALHRVKRVDAPARTGREGSEGRET
jgi:hypothetical protein